VAQCAHKDGKNIILFERDNRFRENGGLKYVKYDLYKGLPKLLHNKYLHAFDKVICDPPFNIKLNVLADDIDELLKNNKHSMAYIIFPSKDKASLVNAMKRKCLYIVDESNQISIEYVRPPKIVRINGIGAIQLYKFTYVS
jgi:16S rRNA G966 N2-methylase RsmD